jgi:pSer/pThr/pTyr-binding forkhead associated (FHA) protein
MAELIGMSQEVRGKNYKIDRDKVTIGRNATNLIVIEHPTVSGRHCCISREGKRFDLCDLGSTNGTRVNSREIREAALKPKDLVQIGSVEFMFDAEESEVLEATEGGETRVEVASGPTSAPVTFGSISPFGARRRSNVLLWYAPIVVLGLLAIAGLVVLIYKLTKSS